MNKSEAKEVAKLKAKDHTVPGMVGYLARAYSALARASLRSRNEIICAAAAIPAIVQHRDFIV